MEKLIYRIKIFVLCLFIFSLGIEYWDPFGIRNVFTVTKFAGVFYTLLSLIYLKKNLSITSLNKPLIFSLFILWFWMLLVSMISSNIYGTDIYLFLGFFQLIVLFWLIYNDIANNPKIRNYIFLSFVFSVVFVSILLSFGIGIENVQGDILREADNTRIYFMGMNPNRMGDLGALAILLVFSLVFSGNYKSKRRYLLLILIPSLLSIVGFSGSRGSFILIFLGLSVFFLLKKQKIHQKIFFIVLGAFFIMLIYNFMSSFEILQKRLEMSLEKGDTGGRVRIWEKVIEIIQENPILGVGQAGYDFKMKQIYGIAIDPHNLFLYIWAVSGIIGIALLTYFYIIVFKRSLINLKENKDVTNMMLFVVSLFLVSKSGGAIELKVIWLILACISPILYSKQTNTS